MFGAGTSEGRSGGKGSSGLISPGNSLVGGSQEAVGGFDAVTWLSNGNYVVVSTYWNNGDIPDSGAVTWGNGATGISGLISSANSLVGGGPNDRAGYDGVTALSNGNYVVISSYQQNGDMGDIG